MKKMVNFALIGTAILFFAACGQKTKQADECATVITTAEEPVVVVTEEFIFDVPVVPKKAAKHEKTAKKEEIETPTKHTTTEVTENLSTVEITPTSKIDTTYFGFTENVLSNTQMVTAFERKGEEHLVMVSQPGNPDAIDYIEFADRKGHVDVYGVSAGMTAKEARHLRRDMRHFERRGKIFLYNEDSNIMYRLDGVTSEGQAVTEEEIDNMTVSAVIWKDKNDRAFAVVVEE